MSRKQALQDLRDKVTAGSDAPFWDMPEKHLNYFVAKEITLIQLANHGSLDAAKSLHDAVLPEWTWRRMDNGSIWLHDEMSNNWTSGNNTDPARAWLIAIIKALIAQEDKA